ncbi:MAG: S-layer family protein [Rivularia sp. ALOHA_DT_140]|nr:S-layer family protein [Rivularia sp. ALOHA_DT_140]
MIENRENNVKTNFIDSGSIQIQGNKISLSDESLILAQNQEKLPSGNLNIKATESLEVILSNIRSQGLFAGKTPDISIYTKNFNMQDSGIITAFNYGLNFGGNIEIEATDSIRLIGSPIDDKAPSNIATSTFNSGNGGNIDISTNKLTVLDGGVISSFSYNIGHAGNLTINSSESVDVIGIEPKFTGSSLLTSLTLGSGNGGNLNVNTKQLRVKNGGRVDASTVGSGAAGSITINALDKVELIGYAPEFLIPSQITSSADIKDISIQKIFGLPQILEGESGAITINTNQLYIVDGASLAVKNDGYGNAGIIKVNANSIHINNQGSISAETKLSEGGDIDLQAQNLLLRRNSYISATSSGNKDGGNINIDTQLLAAFENSDISANSEGSFGGKVTINAEAILGTQFRDFLTPESDITATSGLGTKFNGVVDINTIVINPNVRLLELPNSLTDSSQKIVAGCSANRTSNFTMIGRGGLPEDPSKLLRGNIIMADLFDLVTAPGNQINSVSSIEPIWDLVPNFQV